MRTRFFSVLTGLGLCLALPAVAAWSSPVLAQAPFDDAAAQRADPAMQAQEAGDYTKAIALWTTRAESGEAEAQFRLGLIYVEGKGVPQDYGKAMAWFRKAADQGNPYAQYWVGRMHERGQGTPPDYGAAAIWYQKGCLQRHTPSCVDLARLYERGGPGLTQDLALAYENYELGILSIPGNVFGYSEAYEARDALKARLTPEQIAATTEKVRVHYPSYDPDRPVVQKAVPMPAPKLQNRDLVRLHLNAQLGDAAKQTELGGAFLGRRGVKANYPMAVAWLKKAAEQDYDYAQSELGGLYLAGTGVAKDLALAIAWLGKAAAQGHGYAQYQLGKLYQDGEGVPQNDVQAYVWFDLATRSSHGGVFGGSDAEARDAIAARMTPDQMMQARAQVKAWQPAPPSQAQQVAAANELYNRGDDAGAMAALTPLAEAGNANAQFRLALICEYGEGAIKNEAAAAAWYEKAARQGNAPAQGALGKLYLDGRGVRQDYKAGAKWLEKASDQNFAFAQVLWGVLYLKGEGVTKNPGSAVFLFQKAAKQGNEIGLLYLGMMTFHGIGIAKDPVEAYKWVILAETYASGDASRDSILKLKADIAATLTQEQIDQAENRAGFWSPVFPMP